MDSIIIALPDTDDKRSVKLLNFLMKNNLYKMFVDENIKFIIKIFNKKNKSFFMEYKIYSAPSLYCCLEDDDIKINNFKDIKKEKSEKSDKMTNGGEPKELSMKNVNVDAQNDVSLTSTDFMSNILESLSDDGNSDNDCNDIATKYNSECEKRENNKTKSDSRSFNNIKSIQKFQKPYEPLPALELSNESYLSKL